ncbi:DUF1015 domain-containing protein [Corallococcus sp. EGB]|uniref:DUF1015 domain-containing protein n=1 Tax=Corallococcus sp. EGB TaxID=1521117 RepID=UPI001CBA80A4|nr:DUF1015 family protein [Corallococcus sp. EGB]
MADLQPFRGVRPVEALGQTLCTPPYDVVNTAEARAYAEGNPRSFFHVSRPEIGLPPGTDEHSDAVHAEGRRNLERFISEGWLRQDDAPCFYLYRQRMGSHEQTGVVALARVADYDQGLIRKHELTRSDKEDDRTRHIDTLGGNDEPVFLTYRAVPSIGALMAEGTRARPQYDFTTEDGIGHTFWRVDGTLNARLTAAFHDVPMLYIADGHHRSAAASRVHSLRSQRGEGGGHGRFLAVVFPHDQMQILAYNRVVKDLNGLTPEAFLARLCERFEVSRASSEREDRPHQFGMYLEGGWHQLTARPGTFGATPTEALDVSILQNNVLGALLGIQDPRKDERIQFVGGIRGTAELERLVDSGEWRVAFSLHPTSLDQLMAIADAGEIMPPKSTWFEPKLRSGLVLHLF